MDAKSLRTGNSIRVQDFSFPASFRWKSGRDGVMVTNGLAKAGKKYRIVKRNPCRAKSLSCPLLAESKRLIYDEIRVRLAKRHHEH
jgi:hypothetical protein